MNCFLETLLLVMEKSYRLLKMKWFLSMLLLVNVPAVLHGGGGPEGCVATTDGQHLIIDIDEDFRQGRETFSVFGSLDSVTTTQPAFKVDIVKSATWDTNREEPICIVDESYVTAECRISQSGTRIKLDLLHRFQTYSVQVRPSSKDGEGTREYDFSCYDPVAFEIPPPEKPEADTPEINTSDKRLYIACVVHFIFIDGVIACLFIMRFVPWVRQKWKTLRICPKPDAPKTRSEDVSVNITEMEIEQVNTEMDSHVTEEIRSLADKMKEMEKDVVSLKTQMAVINSRMTEWRQIQTEAASDFVGTGIVKLHDDLDQQAASENPESYAGATKRVASPCWSQPVNPVAAAPASGGFKAQANSSEDQAVTVSSSHAPEPVPAPSDSPPPVALKPQPAVCNTVSSEGRAVQAAMDRQLNKFVEHKNGLRGERPPQEAKPTPPPKSQLALNQAQVLSTKSRCQNTKKQ